MRKHSTPPWRVDYDTQVASVRSANGKAVARCYQGDDDAELIACAPELLTALQNLVADWERVQGRPIPEDHEAKAAINKATT